MSQKKFEWVIEGWDSTQLLWSKRVPSHYFSERQMEEVLKYLCAKYGLTNEEILSSFSRKNCDIHQQFLLVQRSSGSRFAMTCGDNPYFIARADPL